MDAARHTREPARVALSGYTDAIRTGWTDGDLIRAILHDLPRNFRSLGREEQQQVLDPEAPEHGYPMGCAPGRNRGAPLRDPRAAAAGVA